MREQDRRAVEGMARCGIDLEGLISAFSQFPKEEIEEVYHEIHKDELLQNWELATKKMDLRNIAPLV